MTAITEQLIDILDLEAIENNLYRGANEARQHHRLFGGQVLAQALAAAYRTVEDRTCHSLHGYFLRPGNSQRPVLYQVEAIRDGRSFTTRSIKAIQNGEAIFSMDVSFQVEEPGLTHQADLLRDYAPPDDLEDDIVVAKRRWGEKMAKWGNRERPFEIRTVPDAGENCAASWIRFRTPIPDEQPKHQLLLAYASDMSLISTAMVPHRKAMSKGHKSQAGGGLQMASLDHVLWFHGDISVNDWLLYTRETPAAAGSRGFTRGAFYTQDGRLVASVMQEGLIRQRPAPPDKSNREASSGTP
jgi:acyl-CoA thioesterase II